MMMMIIMMITVAVFKPARPFNVDDGDDDVTKIMMTVKMMIMMMMMIIMMMITVTIFKPGRPFIPKSAAKLS